MGSTTRTKDELSREGITSVDDLAEFCDENIWKQIISNCKYPPKVQAADGSLVEQAAFHLPAKSLHRLKTASYAVRYYTETGRTLSPGMMTWNNQLKSFNMQWMAIQNMKKTDNLTVPKITKNLDVVKWLEAYESYAGQKIGCRDSPIAYVIREKKVPEATPPTLARDEPHSEKHGSVRGELIARLTHTHGLYREDNAAVFDDIELATRGTKYAASIAKYKMAKDGREAYEALKNQHAGKSMWDQQAAKCHEFMLNRKFTGGTEMTLERYIQQHRAAHVALEQCRVHVKCVVPDERARVGYLLENIKNNDADLRAAVASIKMDDKPTGLRENFEKAVAILLPTDPVVKKKKKRTRAEISSVTNAPTPQRKKKRSKGRTGVELRYYKYGEFKKLTDAQKEELKKLRAEGKKQGGTQDADGDNGGLNTKRKRARFTKNVVSAVVQQLKDDEEKRSSTISAISSILKSSSTKPPSSTRTVGSAESRGSATKQTVASPGAEAEAEVAATKLFEIMQSMSVSGELGKRGSHKGGKGKGA